MIEHNIFGLLKYYELKNIEEESNNTQSSENILVENDLDAIKLKQLFLNYYDTDANIEDATEDELLFILHKNFLKNFLTYGLFLSKEKWSLGQYGVYKLDPFFAKDYYAQTNEEQEYLDYKERLIDDIDETVSLIKRQEVEKLLPKVEEIDIKNIGAISTNLENLEKTENKEIKEENKEEIIVYDRKKDLNSLYNLEIKKIINLFFKGLYKEELLIFTKELMKSKIEFYFTFHKNSTSIENIKINASYFIDLKAFLFKYIILSENGFLYENYQDFINNVLTPYFLTTHFYKPPHVSFNKNIIDNYIYNIRPLNFSYIKLEKYLNSSLSKEQLINKIVYLLENIYGPDTFDAKTLINDYLFTTYLKNGQILKNVKVWQNLATNNFFFDKISIKEVDQKSLYVNSLWKNTLLFSTDTLNNILNLSNDDYLDYFIYLNLFIDKKNIQSLDYNFINFSKENNIIKPHAISNIKCASIFFENRVSILNLLYSDLNNSTENYINNYKIILQKKFSKYLFQSCTHNWNLNFYMFLKLDEKYAPSFSPYLNNANILLDKENLKNIWKDTFIWLENYVNQKNINDFIISLEDNEQSLFKYFLENSFFHKKNFFLKNFIEEYFIEIKDRKKKEIEELFENLANLQENKK